MENNKEVSVVKSNATRALKTVEELQINSDEDYRTAGEIKIKITSILKMAKSLEDKITKPLSEALKNTREMFNPAKTSCKIANELLIGKMIAYDDLKEERARLEKEKIAAKVESGYIKPETAERKIEEIVVAPQGTKSNNGSNIVRKIKRVRIINESLIPREYLVVDMVKLNQAMLREGKEVPGAETYEEKTMATRAN